MSEPNGPAADSVEIEVAGGGPGGRRRLARRAVGLLLVITSVVLGTYLIVAYFAWESGRATAAEQETTARAEQISRQIDLARQDFDEGSIRLGLTRLDWVLAQDPANPDALALWQRGVTEQEAAAVPTPTDPAAEPSPEPTESAGAAPAAEARPELQAVRRAVAEQEWEAALSRLLAFQQAYPDYERAETDELLYQTYLALGLEYVNTEKVELGLNYLSQAERLGALPQEALDYRTWADLYLWGMSYYKVDWSVATDYFRDLCAVAPFYQSSCVRLNESIVAYGDQFAYNEDWCPAVSLYEEVWRQQPSELLDTKLATARNGCANATPEVLSGTVPITETAPITDTAPPPADGSGG